MQYSPDQIKTIITAYRFAIQLKTHGNKVLPNEMKKVDDFIKNNAAFIDCVDHVQLIHSNGINRESLMAIVDFIYDYEGDEDDF